MSYSVCVSGGRMCDGCMECYDRRSVYEDEEIVYLNLDDDEEDEDDD